jgi:hypothetical protein
VASQHDSKGAETTKNGKVVALSKSRSYALIVPQGRLLEKGAIREDSV